MNYVGVWLINPFLMSVGINFIRIKFSFKNGKWVGLSEQFCEDFYVEINACTVTKNIL